LALYQYIQLQWASNRTMFLTFLTNSTTKKYSCMLWLVGCSLIGPLEPPSTKTVSCSLINVQYIIGRNLMHKSLAQNLSIIVHHHNKLLVSCTLWYPCYIVAHYPWYHICMNSYQGHPEICSQPTSPRNGGYNEWRLQYYIYISFRIGQLLGMLACFDEYTMCKLNLVHYTQNCWLYHMVYTIFEASGTHGHNFCCHSEVHTSFWNCSQSWSHSK